MTATEQADRAAGSDPDWVRGERRIQGPIFGSLAPGAGRKWARSEARLRMRERFGKEQLVQTSLGSRVICGERDLLYEEAPAAYKTSKQ